MLISTKAKDQIKNVKIPIIKEIILSFYYKHYYLVLLIHSLNDLFINN